MHQIIRHFTDDDLYKFTMCCAVIDNYPRAQVKYIFHDRNGTIYPEGFAQELKLQISSLESLRITNEEIGFMKERCPYIPYWFYSFLKGFRYETKGISISQDCDGHLDIGIEGCWHNVILLEVKILAIVSELYYIMTNQKIPADSQDFESSSYNKAKRLIKAGCFFSDFGTRRRASFAAQEASIRAMARCQKEMNGPGSFKGASNVYFCMKYDLTPVGTMAHEFIAAIGGMYGPQMANHLAMKAWEATYRGALGTFLYDTYGWEIFSLNFSEDFARMFKGLRIDSGDNKSQLDKIVAKYQSLGIDPATKQIIFSNALTTEKTLEIQKCAVNKCLPSFGIGTHFTNDFPGIEPLNIVIKLIAAKITESWPFYNETCKISEDQGKITGQEQVVKRYKESLHII